MKNKVLSIVCLIIMLSTVAAHFAQATQSTPSKSNRPQIDPIKLKEAKESCLKDSSFIIPKKGEKPDQAKLEKFRNCMHEKLAPEINRLRQQRK